jgi:hypothetical protein
MNGGQSHPISYFVFGSVPRARAICTLFSVTKADSITRFDRVDIRPLR